ncbi:DEAD/DEAH box helicase [Paenisporosarcina quisquiliarum]|uniref:DEAD/DEAH box helicase n=1 Tax=Paenisporosarcina quisquiliarum TaxID=365346 RepID=UPI003736C015
MNEIQQFLTGRMWLREHTPFSREDIDNEITQGNITPYPGIQSSVKTLITFSYQTNSCRRCGNHQLTSFNCAKCEGSCLYCRNCIRMGRISRCTELISWKGPSLEIKQKVVFAWNGTLTSNQQRASDELLRSVMSNESHLIHAVCGAGKTELLFPIIEELLKEGKRVCVATPRTDVVLEIAPRFKKVFPKTVIHALYGGAPNQEGFAQLIIATTHQLYRFENAFDVIFVDEADAFPYLMDNSLKFAVNKAKKFGTAVNYITATPSKDLLREVKNKSVISSRFHGHPLPVPRFESLWNYSKQIKKGKYPSKLKGWTDERMNKHEPFLIFFPTIELMEQASSLFENIPSVHAEDSKRKEKVMMLRSKQVPGLLTTTILERGITIENLQVAVLGADESIFSSSALIQICGRVGRSPEFPTGDIVFFHHGISNEMDEAKYLIEEHNKVKK